LRVLLFELIMGRTSERPLHWKEVAGQSQTARACHKTLFPDSKSSYFGYSHGPTSFPVSPKGAHIRWNKVLRARPGIGRFTWHRVSEVLESDWWPSRIPLTLEGQVDSEWITTTYTCWGGESGRVPDLSVRPLTYTGSNEGALKMDCRDLGVSLLTRSWSVSVDDSFSHAQACAVPCTSSCLYKEGEA
jgi:hypothetical protein